MDEKYLGLLAANDPLYRFLIDEVVPQFAPRACQAPSFHVRHLGDVRKLGGKQSTPAVFRYHDPNLAIDLVGKFYGDRWLPDWKKQDRPFLAQLMRQEFQNMRAARALGFDRGRFRVVRPLACSERINCVLIEDYVPGTSLHDILSQCTRLDRSFLLDRIADAAHFLAELHVRSRMTEPVDATAATDYLNYVLGQLVGWQKIEESQRVRFEQLGDAWLRHGFLQKARQVMIHGDAMPSHFLFDDARQLTVIDWERFCSGDAAADVGRMLAEIRYSLMREGMPVAEIERCSGFFVQRYTEFASDGGRRATQVPTRVPFYAGCDELRISRNSWLTPDQMRWLVQDAESLLSKQGLPL